MNALPSSRAKLSALIRDADDAGALASAAAASIKSAEARTGKLLHALETADEDRAKELNSEIETMEAEVARLREALGERQSRRDAAQSLVTSLTAWLERIPPNVALEAVAPPAREPSDESTRAAVERYRRTISDLRAEMETVRRAPLPTPDIKKLVRVWVDQHATRGRPIVRVEGEKVDVLFENTRALVPGDRHNAPLSVDTLVWLFRDELATAMDRQVDALNVEGALTRAERGPRLEALRAALVEAERREEAAIVRAQQEGTLITRRSDADARAVLEILFVGAAAKAA
jgi:hypothetical protein